MYKWWLAIIVFIIALSTLVLLAFAYRDFSFGLLALFLLTALGLPIATAMLFQLGEKNRTLWFASKDKVEEKLHDIWIEESDEEYNLEGRFCINE
tara:strand:+ start:1499 stop:1783 length:285 start_codon:yes stop_codon:yes gene_type:complete